MNFLFVRLFYSSFGAMSYFSFLFFWISFKIFLVVITKFMFYSRHLKHLESEMIFAKIYLPANKKMSNSCVLTQWPAPAHSPYVNLFCLCELGHVPIFCNYCRFSFLLRFCVSKFKMMIISFCMIYFKLSKDEKRINYKLLVDDLSHCKIIINCDVRGWGSSQ